MAELVLLTVFVSGLITAWLIVAEKTRVSFSQPIRLNYTGLSASVPQGEGWAGLDRWEYNGDFNLYFLSSELRLQSQPEMYVEWQHLLAERPGDIDEKLKHAVTRIAGSIIEVGQTNSGDLQFRWVKFAQASIDKEGIIAIAELPSGRYLKLVIRTEAQSSSLKTIFENALASARYEQSDLLDNSSDFLVYLKSLGAGTLVKTHLAEEMESMYLVKRNLPNNQGLSIIGFDIQRFEDRYKNGESVGLAAKQLRFVGGFRARIDESDFDCDNDFTRISWQNAVQAANGSGWLKTTVESDSAGQMTLEKAGNSTDYHLSNLVIPRMLIEPAARAFLQYDADRILVEILDHNGRIVPTVLIKQNQNTMSLKPDQLPEPPSFVVKLQYLNDHNPVEYFYFDADKNIMTKHFMSRQTEMILEATNWAELTMKFKRFNPTFDTLFPEREDRKI